MFRKETTNAFFGTIDEGRGESLTMRSLYLFFVLSSLLLQENLGQEPTAEPSWQPSSLPSSLPTTPRPTSAPTQSPTATVISRCGDCWCVPEDGVVLGTCPAFYPGLRQSFPDSWPNILSTFQLQGEPITLKAPDGSANCYPFADAVDPQPNYPRSSDPQCVRPTVTDTNVCAYKYDMMQGCRYRDYELKTYNAEDEAELDGATVIHKGPCGVCSNANDLGVRMKTIETINPFSVACGLNYVSQNFKTRFDGLIQCYKDLGFTTDCATLWAHFGATNVALCAIRCVPGANNDVILNKAPPFCPLSDCISCSATKFEEDFNALAGIWKSAYNAGMNDEIAYPCSYFYRTDLDPCQGSAPTVSPAPSMAASTMSDSSGASSTFSVLASVSIMLGAFVLCLH